MVRRIVAWGLIFVGLVGVVGGLGMAYFASITDTKPTEAERAEYRKIYYQLADAEPPRKSVMPPYAAAGLSVIVGCVLGCVGLRLGVSGRAGVGDAREEKSGDS